MLGGILNRDILAIETGNRTIRLCHSPRGARVTDCLSVDAPIVDGVITDTVVLAEIIENYVATHGLRGSRAILTVRTEKAVIRRVRPPSLKQRDLDNWVSCNISEIFPAGIENYVYSYRMSHDGHKSDGASLYVVFLPTEISDSYADLLTELGHMPKHVDIYQNSLSLGMERLVRGNSIALADISDSKLALIIRGQDMDSIYQVESGGAHREYSMLKAHIPASARFRRGYLLSSRPWALDIFNELIKDGALDDDAIMNAESEVLCLTGLITAGGRSLI